MFIIRILCFPAKPIASYLTKIRIVNIEVWGIKVNSILQGMDKFARN
jgi:hypothetical protein